MSGGITYKGIHSSRFYLTLKSDNRQALSNVTRFTKQVPGRPGLIDFGIDTYEEKTLTVILQYNYKNNMPVLMENIELIGGWLYNDGQYHDLIFDDRPNRVYKAKVVSSVDVRPNNSLVALNVTFTANPPYPFDLDNNPVSPEDVQNRLLWDTAKLEKLQYFQRFFANGIMKFTVGGSLPVKPVIKLMGNIPSGFKMVCGNQTWIYTKGVPNDGIKIDCKKETVTLMSDGSNLFPNVSTTNDTYFILNPGQQKIDVYGVMLMNVTILIDLSPAEVV